VVRWCSIAVASGGDLVLQIQMPLAARLGLRLLAIPLWDLIDGTMKTRLSLPSARACRHGRSDVRVVGRSFGVEGLDENPRFWPLSGASDGDVL
jgi:hypothetical protein